MLEIKPITMSDLDDYYEMNSDFETANLQGFKEFKNKEEAKDTLKRLIHYEREFKICDGDYFFGTISFVPLSLDRNVSTNGVLIGFGIKKECQNQGLMTSFLKEVIDFIFFCTKFDTIFVGCFTNNDKSKKVIEKYFKYLKDETIYFDSLDEYKRTHTYYLSRNDYIHLETERVLIRPFYKIDLYDYFEFSSEEETMNMAGEKANLTLEEASEALDKLINNKSFYAIYSLDLDKVIGLFKEDKIGNLAFLGFILGKKYQHQGIMSEILTELEEQNKSNYNMLAFGIFNENKNCEGLANKLNYKYSSDVSLSFEGLKITRAVKIYYKELISK